MRVNGMAEMLRGGCWKEKEGGGGKQTTMEAGKRRQVDKQGRATNKTWSVGWKLSKIKKWGEGGGRWLASWVPGGGAECKGPLVCRDGRGAEGSRWMTNATGLAQFVVGMTAWWVPVNGCVTYSAGRLADSAQ